MEEYRSNKDTKCELLFFILYMKRVNNRSQIYEDFRQQFKEDCKNLDYYDSPIIKKFINYNQYIDRFLIPHNYDFFKSYNMFDKMMEWRMDNDIDNYRQWDRSNFKNINKLYPNYYHSYSRQNYPIYIDKPGLINANKLYKITTKGEMERMFIYNNEYINNFMYETLSKDSEKKIDKILSIIDLEGVSIKNINNDFISYLKKIINIGQNFYPESIYKVYIVNVNSAFKGLWDIVSRLLDKKTIDKIIVLNKKNYKMLFEDIDEDQVPSEYGGKCVCKLCKINE